MDSRRFVLIWPFCLLLASCSVVSHSSATTAAAEPRPSAARPSVPGSSAALAPGFPSSSPPPVSSQGDAAPGYASYTNPRYGFTALWPSFLRAQPPPTDGDGQAWASPDGRVVLSAYGANNVFSYSPVQDEAADAHGISVTYSAISGNVVTVSGFKDNGSTIVYQRDVVGPGAIDTLYWTYPATQKAQWDAAISLTSLAFQPGDVTTSH